MGTPVTVPDRFLARSLIVALAEKKDDDHFYGSWSGGSRAKGGHPGGGQTIDEHTDENGNWSDERQALHEKYFDSVMDGVPTTDEPTVYMTGGGPASGKTKGLLENPGAGIPDRTKAAHIDPDSAKGHLPEYKAGVANGVKSAAAYTHEESSYMSKAAVARALGSGHSVVYDSVGDSGIDKLHAKVQQMREQGAKRVVANYATVDVGTAIARSDARAAKTGRYVPHAYIRQAHQDVSRTAIAAIERGTFDKLTVWDNSGKSAIKIATYDKSGGGLKVLNKSAWAAFTARGEG
jgi:hypothetical protein